VLGRFKPSYSNGFLRGISVSLLLLLVAVNCFHPFTYGESECAHLFITRPIYIAREIGENFDTQVNISNIENLHSCELIITYNTSLLDVIGIIQGGFFPQQAAFGFVKNESYGFVTVNMSLPELSAPLAGKGTLVRITFEVTQAPTTCTPSILQLDQTQLYNPNSEPIDHNCASAIYFWKSILPDPQVDGRSLDLYTQQGGKGLDKPGGSFDPGQLVHLLSNVTYNNWPQQNMLVAFQALNPLNQTVVILVAETDEEGIARVHFRIPETPESIGTWTAISSVDIACEVVWDTISFQVQPPSGGYSSAIKEYAISSRLMPYSIVIVISTISFIMVKRKTFRRTKYARPLAPSTSPKIK